VVCLRFLFFLFFRFIFDDSDIIVLEHILESDDDAHRYQ
jgi:hypothetical protein